jgi:single-strand DNA-binding protein
MDGAAGEGTGAAGTPGRIGEDMAGSLNKVQLIGTLGRDPESRSVGNGTVVNLRIATSERWHDKQTGERKERTEWHAVTIWNEGIGDVAMRYTKKGSKVYVEGQLETRKWQDQSGADRYTTEIVMRPFGGSLVLLGDPKNGAGEGRGGSEQRQAGASGPTDMDDSIPF